MLRFTSFFPMASFLRITLEFGDEEITEKHKSFVTESERTIAYSEISIIEFAKRTDRRWMNSGVALAVLVSFLISIFNDLVPFIVWQVVFLACLALCIPSLFKQEYCYFLDHNRDYLTIILVTDRNLEDIYRAIELIKSKTLIVSEMHPSFLDVEEEPKFEFIVQRYHDYLNTNTMKFYEDRIVDAQKSLVEEVATEIRYASLNGKFLFAKQGDSSWASLGFFLFFSGLIASMTFSFFAPTLQAGIIILVPAVVVCVLGYLMQYIKRDVVVFYDTNNKVAFSTEIPRGRKQEIEEIIQFVKTKIPQTLET